MSKNETDKDGKALPKPVTLTPEEVQRVAAGAAAVLPALVGRGRIVGVLPPDPY